MIEKLKELKRRFEEIGQLIVQPDVTADMSKYHQLIKEYKNLERVVVKYDEYAEADSNLENAREVLKQEKDPEFREMAKAEIDVLQPKITRLEDELKRLLMPKDPNDGKDVILEIRAGTGGDEASIFAGDLFRMYKFFAESQNWDLSMISCTEGSSGGFKEIILSIKGEDVYGKLKFESGTHRVQRIPATESQGRVHTSAATIAILPEADEIDVKLNMEDIRKDTFRASGAGGQHINKTESAVRLTHISGIVVECQDGRSQHSNYDKALKVLRSRIYEIELKKHNETIRNKRKNMIGSGDRSDKIRTYNYPQGRVTDHRIGYSLYNLPGVMNGEIAGFIEQLRIAENAAAMKEGTR